MTRKRLRPGQGVEDSINATRRDRCSTWGQLMRELPVIPTWPDPSFPYTRNALQEQP